MLVSSKAKMSEVVNCSPSEIKAWVESALDQEDITDYNIEITGTTENGDGYVGIITFVKVVGSKKSNGAIKEYDLAIKSGKRGEGLRAKAPVTETFQQEITMYDTIHEMFKSFQNEKNIKHPFNAIPKCYKTIMCEGTEVLVLDNMRSLGYELHNKFKPMNRHHLITVLKEYGKFHAISFALKDQKPEDFEKATSGFLDVFRQFCEDGKMTQQIIEIYKEACEGIKESGEDFIYERIKQYEEEVVDIMLNISEPKNYQAVITHGDSWNNNFMFMYENENKSKPSNVCILDWQMSKIASPAIDLAYFLYLCASKEDLDNIDDLLNEYYTSFSHHLSALGSDPQKLFTFQDFKKHWKKYQKYGLVMAPFVLKFVLCDNKDAPDFSKDLNEGKELVDFFKFKVKENILYNSRVRDIAKFYVENNNL